MEIFGWCGSVLYGILIGCMKVHMASNHQENVHFTIGESTRNIYGRVHSCKAIYPQTKNSWKKNSALCFCKILLRLRDSFSWEHPRNFFEELALKFIRRELYLMNEREN